MKRTLFIMVVLLVTLVILPTEGVVAPANAQNGLPAAPASVTVQDGDTPGDVVIGWTSAPGANYYRIGWVAYPDYLETTAAGRPWDEAFAFVDVENVGQTSRTVRRLTPGVLYAFTVGSKSAKEGGTSFGAWRTLTLAAGPACPAAPATGQDTPETATGQDYDADDDGLIEIRSIDQLDAIRHDLDGDGAAADDGASAYAAAFPGAADGMGCPSGGCTGYELANDLDYATVGISANGWLPIGYYNSYDDHARFNATFDGNGHAIANPYVSRGDTDYVGLFGLTGSDSVVKRIGLTAANVTGRWVVGGLVGSNAGTIADSYATGSATAVAGVGGLVGVNVVGANWGAITASYATGIASGHDFVGGLVGGAQGSTTASYWDTQTSGLTHSGGGTGLTTAELQAPTDATGIYAAWDPNLWDFGTSSQYPVLKATGPSVAAQRQSTQDPVSTHTMTADGDYDTDNDGLIEIRSIDQLDAVRYDLDGNGAAAGYGTAASAGKATSTYAAAFPDAADGMGCPSGGCTGYELANDLDFGTSVSAPGWAPIGYWKDEEDNDVTHHFAFSATFDGNGHTIANLYVSRGDTNYVGLFGHTGSGSIVKRIGLTSANVVGQGEVGGLVGSNNGAITDSYVSGSVTGSGRQVGGLVGWNNARISASYATGAVTGGSDETGGLVGQNFGDIIASYATGAVTGDTSVGSLVGRNGGAITASYATGSATGVVDVGGLVGRNLRKITASYATGAVTGDTGVGGLAGSNADDADITASYWDTQTSGVTRSNGGTGLTTAELQSPTEATGIYAAWNPSWWDFGASSQYPVLKVDGLDVAAQRR